MIKPKKTEAVKILIRNDINRRPDSKKATNNIDEKHHSTQGSRTKFVGARPPRGHAAMPERKSSRFNDRTKAAGMKSISDGVLHTKERSTRSAPMNSFGNSTKETCQSEEAAIETRQPEDDMLRFWRGIGEVPVGGRKYYESYIQYITGDQASNHSSRDVDELSESTFEMSVPSTVFVPGEERDGVKLTNSELLRNCIGIRPSRQSTKRFHPSPYNSSIQLDRLKRSTTVDGGLAKLSTTVARLNCVTCRQERLNGEHTRIFLSPGQSRLSQGNKMPVKVKRTANLATDAAEVLPVGDAFRQMQRSIFIPVRFDQETQISLGKESKFIDFVDDYLDKNDLICRGISDD